MKLGTFAVLNMLCIAMLPVHAQSYGNNQAAQDASDNTKNISAYIQNWAAYLGYDIANPPANAPSETSTQLLDASQASLAETLLYSTFFGSIPTVTPPNSNPNSGGNESQNPGAPFVPNNTAGASLINSTSNVTFKNYNNLNQQNSVTANPLTDQPPFQSDPVSQAVFNILGTPDISYCTNAKTGVVYNSTNPTNPGQKCSTLIPEMGNTMFQNQIVENVVGTIPSTTQFFSFAQNSNLLPQLNSNALIAPLNYSDEQLPNNSTNPGQNSGSPGLTAATQQQLAANFIRYVSGSIVPTILPNRAAYQALYDQATTSSSDPDSLQNQARAQAAISNYLTTLRVYAAQTSVGMSNLYYIMSRRLPQQSNASGGGGAGGQNNNTLPSQALNEYTMATWRIFKPSSGTEQKAQQWVDKLNQASPATVQKEIAILLSEINYQLYLDRQIQERMLFTQSVSLLQGTKAGQPNSDLSNQVTSAAGTSASQ